MEKQQAPGFTTGVASIVGARKTQQDSYHLFCQDSTHTLIQQSPASQGSDSDSYTGSYSEVIIALTDGVGGEAAGDVAASLAACHFTEYVAQHQQNPELAKHDSKTLLSNAMTVANQAISDSVKKNKRYKGMATTLVGAILNDASLKWISVGDSHLYIIRDKQISKLNADHSMGALIDYDYMQGKISKEEAINAPHRNVILSCLGGKKIELVDLYDEAWVLHSDDRLIFASDGLDSLSRNEIVGVSERHKEADQTAQALVNAVVEKKRPYQDNATVVVIDYKT